jgi:hypothetical protein
VELAPDETLIVEPLSERERHAKRLCVGKCGRKCTCDGICFGAG